jgi:DNA recombination protein RmuC
MDSLLFNLIFLVVGAVLGGAVAWLLLREKLNGAEERGKLQGGLEAAALQERFKAAQQDAQQVRQELAAQQVEGQAARRELEAVRDERSTYQERAARLPQLEKQLQEREARLDELQREHSNFSSRLAERGQEVEGLRTQLAELSSRAQAGEQERNVVRQDRDALQVQLAQLKTRFDADQEQLRKQLSLIGEAKTELTTVFKNIAAEILEDKSKRFTEQNKENLDGLLIPLREKLKDFQDKVEQTYDKESKERLTLQQEIRRLAELNAQISQDAVNLTRALKGDVKTQGAWGEFVLEKVLESSGLRLNEEYTVQGNFANAEGDRYRPDVVINLPEKRHIVVDSKVSLTAYERACSADDDLERELALKQHVLSVRTHVATLSAKNYQTLYGLKSLDFVLMFIAVESASMAALQAERELFTDALQKNVLIVSPSNLIGILRTIAYIWRHEYQNRNAQEIAKQCAALYDKFVGFVGDLDEVGRKLAATQKSYDDARGKLSTGRGNLIRQAEKIRALGVRPSKSLPADLVDQAIENVESELEPQSGEQGTLAPVVRLDDERKSNESHER